MGRIKNFITRDKFFCHVAYRNIFGYLDILKEYSLNAEIYLDSSSFKNCGQDDIDKINKFFADNNLLKIVHGPFVDLNTGSFDDDIRQVTFSKIRLALDITEKLHAGNIVLHTGFDPIFYSERADEWLSKAVVLWKEVLLIAKSKNINVCIENSIDNSPDLIIKLVNEISSPNCFMCFDPAHFNVFGEKSPLEYLKQYPLNEIREIHLSDNNGKKDEHLPLGKGNVEFSKIFNFLHENNIHPFFTIEPHSKEDIILMLESLGMIDN